MDARDLVLQFVDAINRHAAGDIAALLTDDHLFVDSLGAEMRGRARMQKAWEGYFAMVPDYAIVVNETFSAGSIVLLFGTAAGTYSPDGTLPSQNRWSTPAAWRAVVTGDRVAVWQVYADNEPIRAIMRKYSGQQA